MFTTKRSPVKAPEASPAIQNLDLIPVDIYAPQIQWHPESLRRACRQGRVNAVKIGREWRIPQAEAERIRQFGIPVAA